MDNPWRHISLDDYEKHMSLDTVWQMQTLCDIMQRQFARYPVASIMVLGVAGGNGLGHIDPRRFRKVYGVDINDDYLAECVRRYPKLRDIFCAIHADLQDEDAALPQSDLIVANLLIAYIGYECFARVVQKVMPKYVSCVFEADTDRGIVSDSPYRHVFDGLEEIHHRVTATGLTQALAQIGYEVIHRDGTDLPNGKILIRIDYHRLQHKESQCVHANEA